jgi:hypothetical protein
VILLAVTVYHCLLSRKGRGPRHQAAQKMIKDHQKTSKELKGEPAGGARFRAQKMLDDLKTKNVRNFNVAPWCLRPAF